MGEEEKKAEEAKKAEEEKVEKKEEPTKDENPTDGKKEEEAKEAAPPPPPPPQEIVLRVYMHCEGCARKVRRCLKGFDGVEDVMTDCRTSMVVVKGEKADPLKVLERVQRKSHRQVDLLSPIPPPPPPPAAEEPKKPEEKEEAKTEEKTEEPPVISVVLKVNMHCDACAQEIRKRIQRMKGVESVEPDLTSSEVKVKGAFEPEKLVDYVYKRTGKQATIVKVEPEKKEDEKGKTDKEEKKPAEEGEKVADKADEGSKENKEGSPAVVAAGDGEEPPPKQEQQEEPKMESRRNEFYQYYPQNNQVYPHQVYPQRMIQDMYSYPPQIFSDENPNACTVM